MTTHEKEIRSCNKCGKIYKREDHLQKHQEACSTTRKINFSPDPCLMEIQSQTTAASAQLSDNTSVSPVDYDAEMESLYQSWYSPEHGPDEEDQSYLSVTLMSNLSENNVQEPEDVDTQSENENCLVLHDHEVPSLEYEASQLELVDDSDKDIIDF